MPNTNVFTGADGNLLMASFESTPGADGTAIMEHFEISQAVGRVTGVRVNVRTDLREFFEIGFRHVTSLHEGDIHISGCVDRAYINGALLALLMGRKAYDSSATRIFQPELNMAIELNDPADGRREVLSLLGVKFKDWSVNLPEDDIVMENATFLARSIRINETDAPDGSSLSPEFPELEN
ncbi:MAG: hypothetical protein AAFX81_19620 [Pseudomonadota bacterium]